MNIYEVPLVTLILLNRAVLTHVQYKQWVWCDSRTHEDVFNVYLILHLLLLSLVFAVLSFRKPLDSPVDKSELEYKMAEEALKLVEKEYEEGNEYSIAQY